MRAQLARQPVRFVIAGSANTFLDFVVLNVLTLTVGLSVLFANSISVGIGICVSYFLQHYFVFRHPTRVSWSRFLQFFALTAFSSLVLQNLVIWGFEMLFDTRFGNSLLLLPDAEGRHVLGLNIAKAFAVTVGLVWNFSFYRFVVFARPADQGPVVDVRAPVRGSQRGVDRVRDESPGRIL